MRDNRQIDSKEADAETRLNVDWVQADIARSLELRRDFYKYTIGVAASLLAFTTAFPREHTTVVAKESLYWLAWPGLAIAIFSAISVHYIWAWFFISFRNLDYKGNIDAGVSLRRRLQLIRHAFEILIISGLSVGLVGVTRFGIDNYEKL